MNYPQGNSATPLMPTEDQNPQVQPIPQQPPQLYYPQAQQMPPQQQQGYPQGPQYIQVGQPTIGQPMNPAVQPVGQPVVQMPIQNQQPIIINQIHTQVQFRTVPVTMTCPYCSNTITTLTRSELNFCSCLCCFCTGLLPWICYNMCTGKDMTCNDVIHKCPKCGTRVGSYSAC